MVDGFVAAMGITSVVRQRSMHLHHSILEGEAYTLLAG